MSLIEVMVAAVIFTIGSLGLLSLMFVSAEANRTTIAVMTANALASTRLEELLHSDWDSMASGHEDHNLNAIGEATASDFGSRDGTYERSWTVVDDPLGTGLPYRDVRVTVRWFDRQANVNEGTGAWRSITIAGGRLRP